MDEKPFDVPVHVMLGGPGQIRVVNTAARAAEILLHDWPQKPGRKHLAARKACLDVLTGIRESKAARMAFEAAAKEADILSAAPLQRDAMREMMELLNHPNAKRGRRRRS
jgi:hypothetical protein